MSPLVVPARIQHVVLLAGPQQEGECTMLRASLPSGSPTTPPRQRRLSYVACYTASAQNRASKSGL